MSSEGQTIREALDTLLLLLVDEHRTSDEHEIEIREEYAPAFEALAALEARLAEAELALRAIASLRLNTRLSTERAVAQARIRMQEIARAALSSERERIGREKASDELEDALGLPSESETPTTKGTQ